MEVERRIVVGTISVSITDRFAARWSIRKNSFVRQVATSIPRRERAAAVL
jgi:hypothetical protein